MPKWVSSDYYKTNMTMLLAHLAAAEDELKYLESLPQTPKRKAHGMSREAYKAMRKRKVITQLQRAIQARIGWHKEQIALAKSHGVVADETYEPKMRTLGGIGRGIDA
jgi:hypothetical protein